MPGFGWCHRHRRGRTGRMPKPVNIGIIPSVRGFNPFPPTLEEPVVLEAAEMEALRLVDLEKCSFEEAGRRMNVSRNTVWRLAESARRKIITAIIYGKPIIIDMAGLQPPAPDGND